MTSTDKQTRYTDRKDGQTNGQSHRQSAMQSHKQTDRWKDRRARSTVGRKSEAVLILYYAGGGETANHARQAMIQKTDSVILHNNSDKAIYTLHTTIPALLVLAECLSAALSVCPSIFV